MHLREAYITAQKCSFPIKICSVNVTKSAGNHIYCGKLYFLCIECLLLSDAVLGNWNPFKFWTCNLSINPVNIIGFRGFFFVWILFKEQVKAILEILPYVSANWKLKSRKLQLAHPLIIILTVVSTFLGSNERTHFIEIVL